MIGVMMDLIVRLLFQPASWVASQVETASLVVQEDGQTEWQCGQPPDEPTKWYHW